MNASFKTSIYGIKVVFGWHWTLKAQLSNSCEVLDSFLYYTITFGKKTVFIVRI